MTKSINRLIIFSIALMVLNACKKLDKIAKIPTVTVLGPTQIKNTSITVEGQMKWNGDSPILSQGVCFGTKELPSITDTIKLVNKELEKFTILIDSLKNNTTYYVRVFAKNSAGVSYSEQLIAKTTNVETQLASVQTNSAVYVTDSSVKLSGKVTNDGDAAILSKGFCISTNIQPTIYDLKLEVKNSSADFSGEIFGLKNNTTYYVRTYVTNSKGINYGNEQVIKTYHAYAYDIEANKYGVVNIGDQYWLAENLKTTKYTDGTAINTNSIYMSSDYGVYYSRQINIDKVCPVNWHLPSVSDWTALINYLGGSNVAGGKLKESNLKEWKTPNTDASNSFMFSARPTGINGTQNVGESAYFWSSELGNYFPKSLKLDNNSGSAVLTPIFDQDKRVIRCVKN